MFKRLQERYPIIREIKLERKERKKLLEEAKTLFLIEKPANGSLKDYKKALFKHRVSYSEYMYGYEYWKLSEDARNEFISQREMWCIYRKTIHRHVRRHFNNKVTFLKSFNQFVHRKWCYAKETSLDDFESFVLSNNCIAKPLLGTQGQGIYLISEKDKKDIPTLYRKFREKDILLEECISNCDEMKGFHPSSLNTVRVVTVSNKGKCKVIGALFRMGRHGNIIDNTHGGGIFSPIDIQTGCLMMEGIDSMGNKYECHPDTGLQIDGFVVPLWNEILAVCEKATQIIPETYFAGWDLTVTKDGQVELIEGNSAPDVDGGLQAPLKIGIKKKIQSVGKEIIGIDLLQLIPVYSKSIKKWD